jgi:hypothetical protein
MRKVKIRTLPNRLRSLEIQSEHQKKKKDFTQILGILETRRLGI